jgi:hypothetical protein
MQYVIEIFLLAWEMKHDDKHTYLYMYTKLSISPHKHKRANKCALVFP